ncbi:GNAT family N-acetyltransferase [Paenibacillus thalictri]|uniref:GNAT family N-acetyltransferase n=1 Tax=Paenibacillus thalictri TaxID=2527873 RepID=A0A4Q9DHW6_9BACL|nr:GNAT family N-acetyltransferase [Paenibacillus thalictri]TBL70038.1 GNAT family N-acetyltransferase [Paenibacillus thalictri]
MTIRDALKTDVKPAARLLYDALHDIAHQLTGAAVETDALAALEMFFQQETGRLSYRQAVVKELDGHVVGILVSYAGPEAGELDRPMVERLRQLKNDPNVKLDKEAEEDEYYIDTLSVSPLCMGRGIGSELIGEAERRALNAGYRRIALAVEESNEGAHALYVKRGYRTDKEIAINHKTYKHMIKDL